MKSATIGLLLIVVAVVGIGATHVGVGKADITGDAAEVRMMGYGNTQQITTGIIQRLYARAFILQSGSSRVVIVNCDLAFVSQMVWQGVMARLTALYGTSMYTKDNVLLTATHTHSGPGGYSAYALYDITIYGFIEENYNQIVQGIVSAIQQAHNSLAIGRVYVKSIEVNNTGRNRSPQPYANNDDVSQYSRDVDETMVLLEFTDASGNTRGLLAWHPTHGTSFTQGNKHITGDNKGYAEWLLEVQLGVVVAVANSNCGDKSPNLHDDGDGTFSGEGVTERDHAAIVGQRQADAILSLFGSETSVEIVLADTGADLVCKQSFVDFSNVQLPGGLRTCPAVIGQNFAAGTEDGRPVDVAEMIAEGQMSGNPLFSAVSWMIQPTPEWVNSCQSPKVGLVSTGLCSPVPWTPEVLPVSIIKIGPLALAAVPFEVTTMAGRRIRNAMQDSLQYSGVTTVILAAYSNAYAGYLTTYEEYQLQHYEGASTHFGPHQLQATIQELQRVAASVADPSVYCTPGPTPRSFNTGDLYNFQTGVVFDDKGLFESFGQVLTNAATSYSRGSGQAVASATFRGGHPKNNFPAIASFCDVQRYVSSVWTTVLTDNHFNTTFTWQREGVAYNRCTCSWAIMPTTPTGTYRLLHRGYWKSGWDGQLRSYTGTSRSFLVVA